MPLEAASGLGRLIPVSLSAKRFGLLRRGGCLQSAEWPTRLRGIVQERAPAFAMLERLDHARDVFARSLDREIGRTRYVRRDERMRLALERVAR